MAEIVFDGHEADELLEFIEGEGSCALVYDAGSRLYDLLCEREPGRPCRWTLEPAEAAEMVDEIEDCADDAWAAVSAALAERLRALSTGVLAEGGRVADDAGPQPRAQAEEDRGGDGRDDGVPAREDREHADE